MELKIKRLSPLATVPNYAHEGDAGLDLYAIGPTEIEPGESALIPTGISIELPIGYEAQIRPRSGIALKNKVTVLNTPGTIDAGYRGEIGVILINHGKIPFMVVSGMKIAQMVVKEVVAVDVVEVDGLNDTSRGADGFGSTGQ